MAEVVPGGDQGEFHIADDGLVQLLAVEEVLEQFWDFRYLGGATH